MSWHKVALALSIAVFPASCKKDGDDDKKKTEEGGEGPAENYTRIGGTLVLSTQLHGDVSHVVALNTSTGDTVVSEVELDGSFTLDVNQEEPWLLSYIDESQTGADMIVSTFAANTLDTLTSSSETTEVAMGNIDVSSEKAAMELSSADLLTAIGMSEEAAETMGAVDDVSLRYSNPDIDNNGALDAVEGKSYMIDFHNRFNPKTVEGDPLTIADLKNAFYPDDVVFSYTGTGIMPQIPKTDFDGTAPEDYEWSFSVDMPVATNGGALCSGLNAGETLTANTPCLLSHTNDIGANSDKVFVFNMEVSNLKAGDYTLKAGNKTYFWKNVAVSDFSAGHGFLALFTRIDVDTATNKVTGVSYKWQKRGTDGTYVLASDEAISLIVKSSDSEHDFGGFISLKYQGDESKGSIGVMIPKKASGSIVFADELKDGVDFPAVHVDGSVLTEQMVIDGISFDDITENPGISYDDKLGMRFFL